MTSDPRPGPGEAAEPLPAPGPAGAPWPPMAPNDNSAAAAGGSTRPASAPAMAAVTWGAIFGLIAAVPAIAQILLGVAATEANQDGLAAYQSAWAGYQDCLNQAPDPSVCTPPTPGSTVLAVTLTFYGTCFFAFLLSLVVYFFAARQGARAAQRRGPGIWSALIAAAIGSVAYLIAGIIAVQISGRSGLIFGVAAPEGVAPGAWNATLTRVTVITDAIALIPTLGIAALLGLWGAAVGAPRPPSPPRSAMWPAGPYGAPHGAMPPYGAYPPGYGQYGPYGPYGPYPPGAYPPGAYPPGPYPSGSYPPVGAPPPIHPPHPGHPGPSGPPAHPGSPMPPASPPPPGHHSGS